MTFKTLSLGELDVGGPDQRWKLEDESSEAEDTSQTSAREGGGLASAGSDGTLGRDRGSAGGDNRGSGCVLGGPGGLGASRAARIGVSTWLRVQISVREHTRYGR